MDGYILYGAEQSLFTRKLKAALDFYRADYRFQTKRGSGLEEMLEQRAGTHQVPVLLTPENWMIADTTPVIAMLDGRYPRRRLFPDGIAGLIAHLVEEIFDEWFTRTMVHYRWHYPDSARVAAGQLAMGDPDAAARLRDWGSRVCRATGTELPALREAAEDEYRQTLAAMEQQLDVSAWLLGEQPTAADCAALGGLLAHVLNEPDPARIVQDYPGVVRWAEAHARGPEVAEYGSGTAAGLTGFARHVLEGPADEYRKFLLGNRAALAAGEKAFVVNSFGHDTSYLAREYPERSSRMVTERIGNRLDDADRDAAVQLLRDFGLAECFLEVSHAQF